MATSTAVVDGALIYILVFCAILFFLIVFFMIYFAVRYRRSRNPVPCEVSPNPLLEFAWTLLPALLATTMFIYGLTGFTFLRETTKGSMRVKVHARQWTWLFEYENGKKSPDLIVPVGRNVRCELIAADVIHGFYVPAYRLQQDAVPGIKTEVWFNATAPGNNYILCSQYCGQKHSAMLAKLIAVPSEKFDAWLSGKNVSLDGTMRDLAMPKGQSLLFERGCISCHSIDGAAMVGPTFRGFYGSTVTVRSAGRTKKILADADYIRSSIITPGADVADGFPNTMPSGRDVLSDREVDEIVNYLKTIK